MGAYIVQYRDQIDLGYVEPENLVYSENEELITLGYQTRERFQAITKLAKALDIPMETLLLPVAKSQNFEELIDNSLRIIEITPKETGQVLQSLYDIWKSDTRTNWKTREKTRRHWTDNVIEKVIASDDLQVETDSVRDVFFGSYLSSESINISRVLNEANSFSQFIAEQFKTEIDVNTMVRDWVESRIPLEPGSKTYMTDIIMRQDSRWHIPLDCENGDSFAYWLTESLLWRSEDNDFLTFIEGVISSCPDLKRMVIRNGSSYIENAYPILESELKEQAPGQKASAVQYLSHLRASEA